MTIEHDTRPGHRARAICAILLGIACLLTMLPGRSSALPWAVDASGTATLRFDSATGPTTKTVVHNSGTPITFAWKTTNLPSGITCRILLRPNDGYNAVASPASGGTRVDSSINTWSVGSKVFYLRCSNGATSPNVTLTIAPPAPTATLRFDSATGPTSKAIAQNSGTPVTFAWKTTNLPSGTACKILLRPNDSYNAAASPASGGTRIDGNINTWSVGSKVFYLRCANGTTSPDITLTINASSYQLSVQKSGAGSGTVKSSPAGINCGSTCSARFAINAAVTLTATAGGGGSVFIGWTGACNGMASTCTVTMSAAKTVGAVFARLGNGVRAISAGNAHTCAVTDAGAVRCWGYNFNGELGDGTTTDRPTPVAVVGLAGVQAVSAGDHHTCALTYAGTVKCWGRNLHGELGDGTASDLKTPVAVSGLSGVRAISAGGAHTCALTMGGAVKCWGDNLQGQLGDGTGVPRLTPVAVSGLGSGVQAIATGYVHTCALTTAGAVKCWGYNGEGELGDGTTTKRTTPVAVSGLGSGIRAISVRYTHTCALTTAGAVRCWGDNTVGQLGDGTITNRLTPVAVSGLTSGIQAIGAGYQHTCALNTAGAARCWGSNLSGQLGDGTVTNRPTPVAVSGLTSGAQAIDGGTQHTCALTNAGAVRCWGSNAYGSLGDGTFTSRLTPVGTSGLGSDNSVQAVSAGSYHACALTTAGAVWCWGDNFVGNLGDGTNTGSATPVAVRGIPGEVRAISAGDGFTCAVTTTGAAWCWGVNNVGQLGDGTITNRWTPMAVSGLSTGVQTIVTGFEHACVVATAGAALCWGSNAYGELGDGTIINRLTPVAVSGLSSGVQAISSNGAGAQHTCALTSAGAMWCWGRNTSGQLGDGTRTNRSTPVAVSNLGGSVQAISAGGQHTCAITSAGALRCWGWNASGELGDGTTTNRLTPVAVSGLFNGVRAISAGTDHTCAVTSDGMVECWGGVVEEVQPGVVTLTSRTAPVVVPGLASGVRAISAGLHFTCALTTIGALRCWGIDEYGQLGDGKHTQWQAPPVPVVGFTGNGAQAIGTGDNHACALTNTGTVWCWGANADGQLGDGTTTRRLIPVAVSGLGDDVRSLGVRGDRACALTQAGAVRCWGNNNHGQLGDGTRTKRLTPVTVSGLSSGVQAISAGLEHTCALTNAGAVRCWGHNDHGQLGDGTFTERLTPVTVSGLSSGVRAISAGGDHTCALTSAGAVRCWGDNEAGQLGDGTIVNRLTPVTVSGLSSGVQAISAGEVHTCALTAAGAARCWGRNVEGQLGDGTLTDRPTPVAVSGLTSGVQAISAGLDQTCAVAAAGAVSCWGMNDVGQLGDGTTIDHPTPMPVTGLGSGGQAISSGLAYTCALTVSGEARCWGWNANGQLGDGTTTVLRPTPVTVIGL